MGASFKRRESKQSLARPPKGKGAEKDEAEGRYVQRQSGLRCPRFSERNGLDYACEEEASHRACVFGRRSPGFAPLANPAAHRGRTSLSRPAAEFLAGECCRTHYRH